MTDLSKAHDLLDEAERASIMSIEVLARANPKFKSTSAAVGGAMAAALYMLGELSPMEQRIAKMALNCLFEKRGLEAPSKDVFHSKGGAE